MVPVWAVWIGVLFVLAVLIAVLRGGYVLLKNLRELPRIDEVVPNILPNPAPLLSVIIPAKDEEGYIATCVRSILDSDYPNLQVIVVNDRSRDRTDEIVSQMARGDSRVEVLSVHELPVGWTGKTHALFQGTRKSSADFFLFTDADSVMHSEILSRAMSHVLHNDLAMLGLLPGFVELGYIEKMIHPHLALGLSSIHPLGEVNDPNKEAALASGSFIMIRRDAYEQVGTWEQFKEEITEDIALSKAVKAHGLKLLVAVAHEYVRTRPFLDIQAMRWFWQRTFYGGLEKNVAKISRLILNYVSLGIVLPVLMALSIGALCAGQGTLPIRLLLVLSAATMVATIAGYTIFLRTMQAHWAYGLTAPVGLLAAAWVAANTMLAVLKDEGIRWRGSVYR